MRRAHCQGRVRISTWCTGGLILLVLVAMPSAASGQAAPERRLGAAVAESPALFTRVASVRETQAGGLLVSDQGENQLYHYSFGAAAAVPVARRGAGPQEFTTAGWLYPIGGDSTLFTDGYSARWLVLVGTTPVATISEHAPLPKLLGAQLSGVSRSGLVLGVRGTRFADRRPRLRSTADSLALIRGSLRRDGVDTLARIGGRGSAGFQVTPPSGAEPGRIIGANPLAAEDQALLFPDGWIVVARLAPYRVDWITPSGAWTTGPLIPDPGRLADDEERCAAMRRWFGGSNPCDPQRLPGWPPELPRFLPYTPTQPNPALLATPEGHVLIARTPSVKTRTNRYDAVDRRGLPVFVLHLAKNEYVAGFGARHVYVVVTDEDDLQSIRKHPWPWGQ